MHALSPFCLPYSGLHACMQILGLNVYICWRVFKCNRMCYFVVFQGISRNSQVQLYSTCLPRFPDCPFLTEFAFQYHATEPDINTTYASFRARGRECERDSLPLLPHYTQMSRSVGKMPILLIGFQLYVARVGQSYLPPLYYYAVNTSPKTMQGQE